MHWYPISISLLLVASWPSAIEASEDSATQWNYDQIAEYLAETATEENGEVFLESIYNFFKGLTSSNNDRRQLRSNNLASPTVTQVGQTGNKPRFRTPKRTRKTSDADDTRRGLRSLQQQNSFTCTPPENMGQCTAPDPNNVIDECSNLGEPCLDGYEGEYCCLDLCGRKYCTAKGGSRWGPAVVQEITMNDNELGGVLDIMTMVTETDTPTNSPTTELETEELFEVPVSSPTKNEEESPTTSSPTSAPTSAPTYIMDGVTVAGEIKSTTIKCTDTPDWSDSFGDTCSYYKTPAICSTEGNDGDHGGGVAIANCCSCGGGIVTTVVDVATEVMAINVATQPSVIVSDDDDDDDDVFGFPLFPDGTIPAQHAEFQLEIVKQQLSDSTVSISTEMESHNVEDEDI